MKDHNDFTIDPKRFGGLPQFVKEIHAEGMHYVMIIGELLVDNSYNMTPLWYGVQKSTSLVDRYEVVKGRCLYSQRVGNIIVRCWLLAFIFLLYGLVDAQAYVGGLNP